VLQVRISEENTLNEKISGCALKKGNKARSSLRQSNLQLQNEAALMRAIRCGARGTRPPTFSVRGDVICHANPHFYL